MFMCAVSSWGIPKSICRLAVSTSAYLERFVLLSSCHKKLSMSMLHDIGYVLDGSRTSKDPSNESGMLMFIGISIVGGRHSPGLLELWTPMPVI